MRHNAATINCTESTKKWMGKDVVPLLTNIICGLFWRRVRVNSRQIQPETTDMTIAAHCDVHDKLLHHTSIAL